MPYQTITLEIELRFNPLHCAYSFSCQFCNVTDGITTFQITNNVVVFLLSCHGDWSMASPPTCQEVIDVTSTRPLSKDFDVKRFGLNTTSRIKAFVFRFVSIPAKRIRTSNANAIIHSSFFIYSIIWGKDSENLRISQI